jgi:wobble nucleotide-excising tRNase
MLKKITKINGFGILDNFKTENIGKPFNVYNLIYGWNGSGKTTLARLLRCLETKSNHSAFSDADFSIDLADGKVDSKTYIHNLDIKVFNQDFIADNLNLFDAQTNPIVYISKEKVDEKRELDEKKHELKEKQKEFAKIDKDKGILEKKVDDFHKNAGKSIKDFLLGTIYANVTYNKKTSSDIWADLSTKTDPLENFVLSEQELTAQKNYTLLNSKKDEIPLTTLPANIDIDKLSEIEKEVSRLLTTSVVSKVIERLKDNPDIGEWVSAGLSLHKHHGSSSCEFCGQPLQEERINALDGHFSKEYAELISEITDLIGKLEKGIRSELVNESHLLYDNLRQSYDSAITETNNKLQLVNAKINSWIDLLVNKKANPFSVSENLNADGAVFLDFNTELGKLKAIIQEHNKISQSHQQLAEQAKMKIEYHFVSQSAITEKLQEVEKELKAIKEKNDREGVLISSIQEAIKKLEDELKSDTLAIEEINDNLHKFIGRNDITLERQEEGGYRLKRGGVVARNLSEGEKTAISLIYFFSKIQENDAVKANQIIILDDPISSFDSNHLFNASSLIKKSTEGAKQLFVLTHNFWFFKQIRDWMLKKNGGKEDPDVAHFYLAKRGVLMDAGNSLMRFHSEYHYVFNAVLNYQDIDNLDDSLCFIIANSVRRLLEAFTSFKTPDNTGFNGALQLGEKKGLTSQQKERIFYFINKYSHLDRIESFDNTVETLLEEGKNVVNDVLWLIKKVDEDHYKSMLRVCGYQDKLIDKAVPVAVNAIETVAKPA